MGYGIKHMHPPEPPPALLKSNRILQEKGGKTVEFQWGKVENRQELLMVWLKNNGNLRENIKEFFRIEEKISWNSRAVIILVF